MLRIVISLILHLFCVVRLFYINMNDDLIFVLLLLVATAFLYVMSLLSRRVGRFVFERLVSPKAKAKLTNYYNNIFFARMFQGAFAGLCLGPWLGIPVGIVSFIKEDHSGMGIGLIILEFVFIFPMFIFFYSILCSLFGVVFGVLSGILMSIFQKVSRARRTIKHFAKIDTVKFLSSLFVGAIIGGYSLSKLLPNVNLLVCGILGSCFILGGSLLRALYNYLAYKVTKSIVHSFRYFYPSLVFLISVICILLSCVKGKTLNPVLFGHRMATLGPMLFFLCFYGEFSQLNFIKKTGLVMFDTIVGVMGLGEKDLSSLTPIYLFSSSLSFVLTFVITFNMGYAFISIVVVFLSLKYTKLRWVYVAFGVIVASEYWQESSPFLYITVLLLYSFSFTVIEFLETTGKDKIDMSVVLTDKYKLV